MNATHLILNGTAIGLHRGHAYFVFDLTQRESLLALIGMVIFVSFAICICTVRVLKFICECECFEWICPSQNADQKMLMELSTRSSDPMMSHTPRNV